MVVCTEFESVNVALRGRCVKPLHQQTICVFKDITILPFLYFLYNTLNKFSLFNLTNFSKNDKFLEVRKLLGTCRAQACKSDYGNVFRFGLRFFMPCGKEFLYASKQKTRIDICFNYSNYYCTMFCILLFFL